MNIIEKFTTKLNDEFTIGKNIFHCEKTTSTNRIMLTNSNNLFATGDILFADIQTEGIGRYKRKWDSQKGGLYFSILFEQIDDLQNFYKFIILIALAVKEELEELTGDSKNFKIKWPNDIYYKDKKICGILTQTKIQGKKIKLAVGIGININNKFTKRDDFRNPPIALKEIIGKNLNLFTILKNLINKHNSYYNEFMNDNFGYYLSVLNASLYKQNKKIKFTQSGKTITIRPLEISHNGKLIAKTGGEKKLFSFGEIE